MMKRRLKNRHIVLGVLLLLVWMTQLIPALATVYSRTVYPLISYALSGISNLIPFAVGDLFIFVSITGVIVYPFYGRFRKKLPWKRVLLRDGEYLLWVYVWFYLAWGLNYSQKNFYQRTEIPYTAYTPENFKEFVNDYITQLNRSYTPVNSINLDLVREETVRIYNQLSDSLGVHRPPHKSPKVKTMLFTPFISMVGVTGSMGPFFCEFTLNGDLLPPNYPATYAHELAHLLGITSEAEANFYAYQVCTRSKAMGIRFSGYFSVLGHVLRNAQRLLSEEEYTQLFRRIRPEIIELAKENQAYWAAKYSPVVGAVQDWIYDLYLKGNKIESGRQNYSEVVGLLISYREWKNK
ncbi:DUF3810 domain-containing protein [Bacteroides congonensis]|uniref:DUF3810 domain-containing protein n=1 Tax=Bacteroides congonensis TaxID=1871006 RepID=UPI003A8A976B